MMGRTKRSVAAPNVKDTTRKLRSHSKHDETIECEKPLANRGVESGDRHDKEAKQAAGLSDAETPIKRIRRHESSSNAPITEPQQSGSACDDCVSIEISDATIEQTGESGDWCDDSKTHSQPVMSEIGPFFAVSFDANGSVTSSIKESGHSRELPSHETDSESTKSSQNLVSEKSFVCHEDDERNETTAYETCESKADVSLWGEVDSDALRDALLKAEEVRLRAEQENRDNSGVKKRGLSEEIDLELSRGDESSPTFSPPSSPQPERTMQPPVGNERRNQITLDNKAGLSSPSGLSLLMTSSDHVHRLSTQEIKSLNVDTQFKLANASVCSREVESQRRGKRSPAEEPAEAQVKSLGISNSVTEEQLDYVEEVGEQTALDDANTDQVHLSHRLDQRTHSQRPAPTCIVHVRNLVRPFQVPQLKELLSKEDLIIDSSFWIDRIKSHCFVTFESVEAAQRARDRLHKLVWPSGSPKVLEIDFSTAAELERFVSAEKRGIKIEVTSQYGSDGRSSYRRQSRRLDDSLDSRRSPPHKRVSPTRHRQQQDARQSPRPHSKEHSSAATQHAGKKPAVREWDLPKLEPKPSGEVDTSKKPTGNEKKETDPKTTGPSNETSQPTPAQQPSKQESGKLLDDLFRKTAAKPFIYWLPLTEEQIEQRDKREQTRKDQYEQRMREREEERAKRLAAASARARASPTYGRRGSAGRSRQLDGLSSGSRTGSRRYHDDRTADESRRDRRQHRSRSRHSIGRSHRRYGSRRAAIR